MSMQTKPRVRVTWDEHGVIQWPSEPAPVDQPSTPPEAQAPVTDTALPLEDTVHELGGSCPHCGGLGRYFHHQYRSWDKCYRCDGKGILDAFDLALLRFRLQGAGPVNRVYGGPPWHLDAEE